MKLKRLTETSSTSCCSLLDDGRLTDSQGRTVDFSNCIIVMTSNIGSQSIIDITNEGGDSKEMHNRCMDSLQAHFLPEFLNRIDEVIVFKPLGREEIREIVDLQVRQLNNQLADNGFTLEVTDAAKDLLANEGYDQKYGARPLKRVIQQRLQNCARQRNTRWQFCGRIDNSNRCCGGAVRVCSDVVGRAERSEPRQTRYNCPANSSFNLPGLAALGPAYEERRCPITADGLSTAVRTSSQL